MVIRGMNEAHSNEDEGQDGGDLQHDHDVVGLSRLANTANQNNGQQHDNEESSDIKTKMPTRCVKRIALQVGKSAGQVGRRDPAQCGMPAEPLKGRRHLRGESDAHRHVADGVFEDQVPADDPGDELAHGCVSVGVGAARDRNHRRQLRITETGEGADDGDQDQRNRQRWSRSGAPQRSRMMHDVVGKRGVQDGRGIELLPGDRSADDGKDAGADHGADAQCGQRPRAERLLQPMFRLL